MLIGVGEAVWVKAELTEDGFCAANSALLRFARSKRACRSNEELVSVVDEMGGGESNGAS